MSVIIRVRPVPELRREFARWAVAQTPKLRTVSEVEFGVPAFLFPAIPEPLLAGALVDGLPYVAPGPALSEGDQGAGQAPPTAAETVPSAAADLNAQPPVPLASADGLEEPDGPLAGGLDGQGHPCGVEGCLRVFDTERGAAAHRRKVHGSDDEG